MAELCTCTFQRHILPQLTRENELRDLLRSDGPPSTFQAAHCRSISASSPAELERYDDEIARLKAALLRAEFERAAVADYSHLCDAVVSPVRRLPSEILVGIFGYFSTAFQHWPWLDRPRKRKIAEIKRLANVDLLRISRVCSRWHQLIMGTSCLWNCVDLDLRLWDDELDPQLLFLLQIILDRGGNVPLDLALVCGDGDATSRTLELLATCSCRWRNASFLLYGSLKHLRLPAIEGNLPLLENLAVEVGSWDASEEIPFFEVAP